MVFHQDGMKKKTTEGLLLYILLGKNAILWDGASWISLIPKAMLSLHRSNSFVMRPAGRQEVFIQEAAKSLTVNGIG